MIRFLALAIFAFGLAMPLAPAALAQDFAGAKAYVRASTLRIRTSASAEAEIIDRLTAGHPVYVMIETDGWAFIEYSRDGGPDRYRGWAAAKYVR